MEYVDPREPAQGSHQVGAFFREAEARACLQRVASEGLFAELRVDLASV
jgi:hypothetical protein